MSRYGWKETRAYLETKFDEMTATFKQSVQIGKEEPRVRMENFGCMRGVVHELYELKVDLICSS
jgi:hypothetical protein